MKLIFAIPLAACFCIPQSQGAPIAWRVYNITGNLSDISTQGTSVVAHAGSWGGTTKDAVDGATISVNGVTFDDGYTLDKPNHFDAINKRVVPPIKDEYYELLRTMDRQSHEDASVTFDNLTIGNTYQIQVWYTDNSETAGLNGVVLGNGLDAPPNPKTAGHVVVLPEVEEDEPGQYAIGTFVADATTQSFALRRWVKLATEPKAEFNTALNAYQLRDLGVTDPANPVAGQPEESPDFRTWGVAQNWKFGDPGTAGGEDFDKDGMTNDEERIFGLDPTDPASSSPFGTSGDVTKGSFQYTRRSQSLTGLSYSIWYSTDNTEWMMDKAATQKPGPPKDDVETVAVQISSALLAEPNLSIQIRVEK